MARGRKTKQQKQDESSLLKLVKYNPEIMEEGTKSPNILIDDYVGVCIDEYNYELVKVKQTTVTEDNIRSTTNKYEDKYEVGDTYQEWCSMEKYLSSFEQAVETYADLKFREEESKLKYCKDMNILIEIRKKIYNDINKFLTKNIVPEVAKLISNTLDESQKAKLDMSKVDESIKSAMKECDGLIQVVSEKRAMMVSKGIIDGKKIKHRIKKED